MAHSIAIFLAVHAAPIRHVRSTGNSDVSLQLWQVINLIGAPMLALLFLPAVVEDLRMWIRSLREDDRPDWER